MRERDVIVCAGRVCAATGFTLFRGAGVGYYNLSAGLVCAGTGFPTHHGTTGISRNARNKKKPRDNSGGKNPEDWSLSDIMVRARRGARATTMRYRRRSDRAVSSHQTGSSTTRVTATVTLLRGRNTLDMHIRQI